MATRRFLTLVVDTILWEKAQEVCSRSLAEEKIVCLYIADCVFVIVVSARRCITDATQIFYL